MLMVSAIKVALVCPRSPTGTFGQLFRLGSSSAVASGKSLRKSKISQIRYIPATAEQIRGLNPNLDGIWHEQEVMPVLEGNFYDGEFVQGQWHGQGKLHLKDGTVYSGEFFAGKRNGKGTLTRSDGTKLVGMWDNGRLLEAIAEVRVPDQIQSAGKLSENTPRGNDHSRNATSSSAPPKASSRTAAESPYTPHSSASIVHSASAAGKHEIRYSNGDNYTGDTVGEKKHGQGTLYYGDGGMYRGEWRDNLQYGQGTAVYPFGATYVGEWAQGLRHGPGKVSYADGQAGFAGEFRNNKVYNGTGRYVSVSGAVFVGTWVNGLLEGEGSIWYSKDSHSEGEFRLGKVFHGTRVYRDPNGKVFKVTYSAGKQVKSKLLKQ